VTDNAMPEAGELGAGGYHWKTQEHVTRWIERKEELASVREAGFAALLAELPIDLDAPLRIVDLGAGDGAVAELVLDKYSRADALLVDFSQLMVENGNARLNRFAGRYRYIHWDMNTDDWPGTLKGPFDAVVSSAAIHHLENPRKEWLARTVFRRLVPGGVFTNYDLFRDPEAQFAEDEIHGRTCATIAEARGFLVNAGYRDVAVQERSAYPSQKAELGLIVGRKPLVRC
jgi:cyclopropane fatty-acyl-phospholipid synthase-like methyltransferase